MKDLFPITAQKCGLTSLISCRKFPQPSRLPAALFGRARGGQAWQGTGPTALQSGFAPPNTAELEAAQIPVGRIAPNDHNPFPMRKYLAVLRQRFPTGRRSLATAKASDLVASLSPSIASFSVRRIPPAFRGKNAPERAVGVFPGNTSLFRGVLK